MGTRISGLLTVIVVAASLSATVHAEDEQDHREYRVLSDKWNVMLGGMLADFDTTIVVSRTVVGGVLDVESTLGLDPDESSLVGGGAWRFGRRGRSGIDFQVATFRRRGESIIDEEIVINDRVIPINAAVRTRIDTDLYRFGYTYSFSDRERLRAGFAAGLSVFGLAAEFDAEWQTGDPMNPTMERVATASDIIAPVPSIGLFVIYGFTPNFIFRSNAEFFDISVDRHKGKLVQSAILVEYYFTRTFGIGGGSGATLLNYDNDSGSKRLRVDYEISSLIWYLTFVFGKADPPS